MYQAAIVEDEAQIRSYIRDTLIESFEEQQVHVSFDCFASGDKFLSMFDQHYHFDIIFLDIEMPGIDGISICRRIRELMPDVLVVFISNKEELVFQTFEVQPFRFIRKSEYDKQRGELVSALVHKLKSASSHLIHIKESASGDLFSFDVKNIIYVEAQRKDCRIVTTTGDTIVHCKLMELEVALSAYSFLKPHRSYLVNCSYIFYIGKSNLQLTNKEELPISRNKIEEIKAAFLAYTTQSI